MGKTIKSKRVLELVTSPSLGYKQVQKNVFISYIYITWPSLMVLFIWSGFLFIPKITPSNLCKPMHDINYSTSIGCFESRKSEKEEGKIQKFEYLENEKSFLDDIKNIFHSFWRAIIWWKIKNLIKNSKHKL